MVDPKSVPLSSSIPVSLQRNVQVPISDGHVTVVVSHCQRNWNRITFFAEEERSTSGLLRGLRMDYFGSRDISSPSFDKLLLRWTDCDTNWRLKIEKTHRLRGCSAALTPPSLLWMSSASHDHFLHLSTVREQAPPSSQNIKCSVHH